VTEAGPDDRSLERAIERGASRYRTLAEASALAVWRADATGKLVSDMPGWREVTGQREDELVGDGWLDAIPESDRRRVAEAWATAVRTGSTYDLEYPVRAEDGTERRIHARGLPRYEDGRIVEWIGTANDITDRHGAMLELQAEKLAVETLRDIGVTLSGELELSKVVHALTEATTNLTGAHAAAFLPAGDGGDGGGDDAPFPLAADAAVLAPALAGEPVRAANLPDHPDHPELRSLLAVPVVSRSGRVHGALALGHEEPGRFTERHERLVVGIASQAAIALDNAALYEAERRARADAETARHRLELLAAASLRMALSLDVAETATALAEACLPELADSSAVFLVGPDQKVEAVAVEHVDPGKAKLLREILERYPVRYDAPYGSGAAIRTGEPSFQPVVDEDLRRRFAVDDEHFEMGAAIAPSSVISVPLLARDRIIGALAVRREEGERYSEDDLAVVEELARRGAVALDNARLYAQERSAGLMLQRSLLPRLLPTLRSATCAVRYLPGAAGAEVGGDWYDVVALADDAVAVAIGDVQGRGLVAASVMGQLRSAVRAYGLEDHEPKDVVARADRVVASLEEGPFATCTYARYEPAQDRLVLANAGHLPPLLLDDGGATFLELDPGLPLGVGGATFEQSVVDVRQGSVLVLYTDGLVEDPDTPLDVGMARLRDVAVEALADGLGVEDVADRILDALVPEGHGDDVALLVLSIGGTASDRVVELADDPAALGTARRAVEEVAATIAEALEEPAGRLVTTVVGEAIRHAGSAGRLRVRASGRRLRVEVFDLGDRPDARRRSLQSLDALAADWGVEPTGAGTCVWFELTAGTTGNRTISSPPPEVPHGPAA
jgi:PAS domain S-box-containing protein